MKYKIFISYSHLDEKYRVELEKHLIVLQRKKLIESWSDRKIIAGQEWDGTIKNELDNAHIIFLLVSPDFLASDYCDSVEVRKAIEKHNSGQAMVVPIILRHCDWKETNFAHLQGLPKDGKPVTTWDFIDEAYLNIVEGIKKAIGELSKLIENREIINDYQYFRAEEKDYNIPLLEQATGLIDFAVQLKNSKYHPINVVPRINSGFLFMGHGASKWTNELEIFEKALQRIIVNDGKVKFLTFDPRFAEAEEQKKILLSLNTLRNLAIKYGQRKQGFMKIKLYNEYPTFRLAFVNQQVVIVSHYKAYTANSIDGPILIFESKEEWSFYSAFKAVFNEKWQKSTFLDEIWEDLLPLYEKYNIVTV